MGSAEGLEVARLSESGIRASAAGLMLRVAWMMASWKMRKNDHNSSGRCSWQHFLFWKDQGGAVSAMQSQFLGPEYGCPCLREATLEGNQPGSQTGTLETGLLLRNFV